MKALSAVLALFALLTLAVPAVAVVFGAGDDPPGGSAIETILMVLVGVVIGPLVTAALKRFTWVDAQLGAAINLAVVLVFYVGAWWLSTGGDRAQLETFLLWALAAAGIGGAANNVWRKRVAPRIG